MSPQKLERLLDRHVLVAGPQDINPGGTGCPRLFTDATARRFALAAALMDVGLSPKGAARIADRHAADAGVLVVDANGVIQRVASQDDLTLEGAAVIVDLAAVNARVSQRLAA
jgi:hypothetical protein